MKIYLVGGAVRDKLLKSPIKDRDYVVVGATPSEMEDMGYKQVGSDFPVFLHPDTNDEYALARKERKVGVGYNGFKVEFNPGITLEDDLYRRDLTINAMAIGDDGNIIDYFGGQDDLKNGVLRHVSKHFSEDPVRALRVCRFRARYGFSIAGETKTLISEIVVAGEIEHLTKERVWLEIEKSMGEIFPSMFWESMSELGILDRLPGFRGANIDFKPLDTIVDVNTDSTVDSRIAYVFSQIDPKHIPSYSCTKEQAKHIGFWRDIGKSVLDYPSMAATERLALINRFKATQNMDDLRTFIGAVASISYPNEEVEGMVGYCIGFIEGDVKSLKTVDYQRLIADNKGLNPKNVVHEKQIEVLSVQALRAKRGM